MFCAQIAICTELITLWVNKEMDWRCKLNTENGPQDRLFSRNEPASSSVFQLFYAEVNCCKYISERLKSRISKVQLSDNITDYMLQHVGNT